MSSEVTTRFLTPDEYPRWTELVAGSPTGSVYAMPDYLDVLSRATDASFRILVAERSGCVIGGVPLYERRLRAGRYVSHRLLLYYNGVVLAPHEAQTPSQQTEWNLHALGALEQALARLPFGRIRFRNRANLTDLRVFQPPTWSILPTWSYEVEIVDIDKTWERIDKNQRRLIRRCTERNLRMTMDWDFESFYRLHVATLQRKGAHAYLPREEFKSFVDSLHRKNLGRLYQARLPDGRAIAVQLVLTGPHPVSHTVCVGGDEEAKQLGASSFLRWKVFQDLHEAGYRGNDLTDAALNPVTRFKSQAGGDLKLCLQVSRRDHLAFRLGDSLASLAGRAGEKLARVAHGSTAAP